MNTALVYTQQATDAVEKICNAFGITFNPEAMAADVLTLAKDFYEFSLLAEGIFEYGKSMTTGVLQIDCGTGRVYFKAQDGHFNYRKNTSITRLDDEPFDIQTANQDPMLANANFSVVHGEGDNKTTVYPEDSCLLDMRFHQKIHFDEKYLFQNPNLRSHGENAEKNITFFVNQKLEISVRVL